MNWNSEMSTMTPTLWIQQFVKGHTVQVATFHTSTPTVHWQLQYKGKATLVQAWTDHEVPWSLSLPDSRQMLHEGSKVVSPMHRPTLPPRKYSWYFCQLQDESVPGPQCDWKNYANKNSNDTIGNQNQDLLTCNAVPQPTVPLHAPCRLKEVLLNKQNKTSSSIFI